VTPNRCARRCREALMKYVWMSIAIVALTMTDAAAEHAFLGVRLLKNADVGEIAWKVEVPADCRVVLNAQSSGQNPKEIFFHVLAPDSEPVIGPIHVKVDPHAVRGVLVGNTDVNLGKRGFVREQPRTDGVARVPFERRADGISFALPLQPVGASLPPDDLGDVSQSYTYIETPGVYIRIAHADEQRRRGPYATGRWPEVEAKAALNLEFAAREAISALRLDTELSKHGVTTIMLMNFDTHYPTLGPDSAHEDWPPHWHMHLYWRDAPRVRKVGHFYLAPDGLLTQNMSSDFISLPDKTRRNDWYGQGQADETRAPDGTLLFSHTITPEGHFTLASARGACRFKPVSSGFDSGVILSCDDGPKALHVRAEDGPAIGRVRLYLDNRLAQEYRYDPDTGELTSM
jgi:hypothetical protein